MIVRELPSLASLFTADEGAIAPKVFPEVLGFMLLSLIVVASDKLLIDLPHIGVGSMSVFGIALSLFLGFRNNAAYSRWWEARKLWGNLVTNCRNLSRELVVFIDDPKVHREILTLVAVYVHLHRGKLQNADVTEQTNYWVNANELKPFEQYNNPASAVLRAVNEKVGASYKRGQLCDTGARSLTQRISYISNAQGGNERIFSTPIPFIYSLLILRTSYLYCLLLPLALIDVAGWFAPLFSGAVAYIFLGLSAVTNELEHPFEQSPNALPLKTLCRVIEIDIAESLEQEPLPALKPQNHLLV